MAAIQNYLVIDYMLDHKQKLGFIKKFQLSAKKVLKVRFFPVKLGAFILNDSQFYTFTVHKTSQVY